MQIEEILMLSLVISPFILFFMFIAIYNKQVSKSIAEKAEFKPKINPDFYKSNSIVQYSRTPKPIMTKPDTRKYQYQTSKDESEIYEKTFCSSYSSDCYSSSDSSSSSSSGGCN